MNKAEIEEERKIILDLKKELEEQEELKSQIVDKIYELRERIREKEYNLSIYDYYSKLREFLSNAKDFETHYIRRDTATRELMTNLKRGKYIYEKYGFKNGEYGVVKEEKRHVDYYIINSEYILIYSGRLNLQYRPEVHSSLTATEFKKSGRLYNPPLKNKSDDMYVPLTNGKKVHLYDNPIKLCGQTYDDMDYRKEWMNGELEYEGNNYGDTSSFYFVGRIEY